MVTAIAMMKQQSMWFGLFFGVSGAIGELPFPCQHPPRVGQVRALSECFMCRLCAQACVDPNADLASEIEMEPLLPKLLEY